MLGVSLPLIRLSRDLVRVVTPEEMDQVRPRLEAFAAEMLGGLARSDQRAKGELYLRGLMLDGKRKSMQPMAERLGRGPSAAAAVRHLLDLGLRARSGSGWRGGPMTFIAPEALRRSTTSASPRTARTRRGWRGMYSGTLGKVGNCQIGVSVHAGHRHRLGGDRLARCSCPKSWDDTTSTDDPMRPRQIRRRRGTAQDPRRGPAPGEVAPGPGHARPDHRSAQAGGEAGGWGLPVRRRRRLRRHHRVPPGPDRARPALRGRGQGHHQRLPRPTPYPSAPPYSGRGRPPKPRYRDDPTNLAAARPGRRPRRLQHGHLAPRHPQDHQRNPTAAMRSQFLALRVRPANRDIPRDADGSPARVLAASPNGHPTKPNPPTTGSPTCPPTPHCANWSDSPRSAGGSSTTTANSKTASASTTSKAAATSAGTATSPSPPSPKPSAPCCAHDPKAPAPA